MELFPHAFPLDLAQVAAVFAAIVLTLFGMWDAFKDAEPFIRGRLERRGALVVWAASPDRINGPRSIVAKGNIRVEIVKLLVLVLFLVSGVTSALLPPPHLPGLDTRLGVSGEQEAFAAQVARLTVILATLALLVDSFLGRVERRRYIRRVRKEAKAVEVAGRRASDPPTVAQTPEAAALEMVEKAHDAVGAAHVSMERAETVLAQAEDDHEAVGKVPDAPVAPPAPAGRADDAEPGP